MHGRVAEIFVQAAVKFVRSVTADNADAHGRSASAAEVQLRSGDRHLSYILQARLNDELNAVIHPLFDDLAALLRAGRTRMDAVGPLLRPLGLAVWLADVGRLDLRAGSFLPMQQELALAS